MPNAISNTRAALANCLTDAEIPELPNFQRGKVRDSYDLPDGRRVMIATDRQSAFDIVLAAVPFNRTLALQQGSGPLLRPWH